jgi:hypothetical protein
MSERPMQVPPGEEKYRFAELQIHLPSDWPLTNAALKDPNSAWPIKWLRRIARYPHETQTWLGGPISVFSNPDSSARLAPHVRLSDFLLTVCVNDPPPLQLDTHLVQFYTIVPIYRQERDLEAAEGYVRLFELFGRYGISEIVDVRRLNVALSR